MNPNYNSFNDPNKPPSLFTSNQNQQNQFPSLQSAPQPTTNTQGFQNSFNQQPSQNLFTTPNQAQFGQNFNANGPNFGQTNVPQSTQNPFFQPTIGNQGGNILGQAANQGNYQNTQLGTQGNSTVGQGQQSTFTQGFNAQSNAQAGFSTQQGFNAQSNTQPSFSTQPGFNAQSNTQPGFNAQQGFNANPSFMQSTNQNSFNQTLQPQLSTQPALNNSFQQIQLKPGPDTFQTSILQPSQNMFNQTQIQSESQSQFNQTLPSFNQQNSQPLSNQPQSFDSKLDTKISEKIALSSAVKQEIPLNFINKTASEIIQDLKKKLEANSKIFTKKATLVYSVDEMIIKARNNYLTVLKALEEEEQKLAELEENVEFFTKLVSENKSSKSVLGEVEDLCDEYNKWVEEQREDDEEVEALVGENMELIKWIKDEMDEMERRM